MARRTCWGVWLVRVEDSAPGRLCFISVDQETPGFGRRRLTLHDTATPSIFEPINGFLPDSLSASNLLLVPRRRAKPTLCHQGRSTHHTRTHPSCRLYGPQTPPRNRIDHFHPPFPATDQDRPTTRTPRHAFDAQTHMIYICVPAIGIWQLLLLGRVVSMRSRLPWFGPFVGNRGGATGRVSGYKGADGRVDV